MEKYEAAQSFPCRKIEIRRNTEKMVILFLKLEPLWIWKSKVGSNVLALSRVYHNHSFLLTLTLKIEDMCYDTIGSNMLKIESQPN